MSEWVAVAPAAEIPPGGRRSVDLDGTPVLVLNLGGTWHAIEDQCSHDGGAFDDGPAEGDQIMCPRHGARFCLRTGNALSAPAYEPVHVFPLRIENGVVEIRDPRFD